MPTSTGSSLFRFLLSLVIRLRLSVGRIALTFRARFASFWRSIPTFARRRGQPQIRLCANDVPMVDNNPVGEHSHISEHAKVEEKDSGTLAALPVWRPASWRDELLKYQEPPSSDQPEPAFPATPEGGSQRYKPRRLRWATWDSVCPTPLLFVHSGPQTERQPFCHSSWPTHTLDCVSCLFLRDMSTH